MQTEIEQFKKKGKEHPPKKCEHCGKEFTPKNVRAKYCSPSCNATASKIRTAVNSGAMQQPQQMMGLPSMQQVFSGGHSIPPYAQMMIDHHKKEAERWEKKYDAEVTEHKEAKKKIESLKEEIKDIEKPGGLNGFMDSNKEVVIAAMEHLGPVLSGLFNKGGNSNAGSPAQLEGAKDEYGPGFGQWMQSLKPETRANISNLITQLAQMGQEDEEKMNYTVLQILQS